MTTLIAFVFFIACTGAILYYFYLVASLLDIRDERKRMERRRRRGY